MFRKVENKFWTPVQVQQVKLHSPGSKISSSTQAMDKRKQLTEELNITNSCTNQGSNVEQFVCKVASSGLVQKSKLDKYGTLHSNSTIPLQEVRSSDNENVRDPLESFEVNSARNVIPLLAQSQITNIETSEEITLLENAKKTYPDDAINRTAKESNSTNVVNPIASLESIAVNNSPIRINQIISSQNAMENVIAGKSTSENVVVRATVNSTDSGSDVHICDQCGKSFKKISSLHGHMGSHRRADYKRMRMMPEQTISLEPSDTAVVSLPNSNKKKKAKLTRFMGASRAIVDMSMAPVWHPKHGTATIDLSASVTFSYDAHTSGEKAEMMEVAKILTTLVERISKETVKVPSPSSSKVFVCTKCNKEFFSYQALGGHMSFHNKRKNMLLEDGSGSSSGSSEQFTWKYVSNKCNKKFATGPLFDGHKSNHYYEESKMMSPADANMKPPTSYPHETIQSSEPAVLPTDENMHPPVLLASDNMHPTITEQVVANATVHKRLPQAFEAVQQSQKANGLGKETEPPSGAPQILAHMQMPLADRCFSRLEYDATRYQWHGTMRRVNCFKAAHGG